MRRTRWFFAPVLFVLLILTSAPVPADWDPGDEFKMHFPQLPDPNGWDVSASIPSAVADDWQCSETGYVSDIHIWGSWFADSPIPILNFHLEIWSDQPADPPSIPFSRPLTLLWAYDAPVGAFIERPYGDPGNQGWYDPLTGIIEPGNHLLTFQYNFFIPDEEAFIQEEGTIYWLVVQVMLDGPPMWGWKTSLDHWNDDSVFLDNTQEWVELLDPLEPGISLDQAFVITGKPLVDWGDAPDPTYPTLAASSGANHTLGSGLTLGATVDGDPNGQPDSTATGDDNDGNDDEDGVSHSPGTVVSGATVYVTVTASTSGYINAWVDFNADGDWTDTGEQVFNDVPVVTGANSLSFTAPVTVVTPTFARYRFDTTGGLTDIGPAADGEVEDYYFEDPIFIDGFESGDTTAWSYTVGLAP